MQTSIDPFTSHRLASLGLICACLIVASHSGFVCTDSGIGGAKWWLSRFLSQVGGIAVPFFFLTAAYFLAGHVGERGWWGRETRKRVVSLLLPFFLWSALWALYVLVVAAGEWVVTGMPLGTSLAEHFGEPWVVIGLDPFQVPAFDYLWFVRSLFLLVVLSPFLAWPIQRRGWGAAWVLFWLALFIVVDNSPLPQEGPWAMVADARGLFSPRSFAYFTAGLWLRRWPMTTPPRNTLCWVFLALGLGGMALAVTPPGPWFGWIHWAFVPLVLCGLWWTLPGSAWPRWLTGLAFPLYLSHKFFVATFRNLTVLLPASVTFFSTVPGYLTVVACGLFGSAAIALGLRRWCPRVAATLFGGR